MTLQDVMELAKQLSPMDKKSLIEQLRYDLELDAQKDKNLKTLENIQQFLTSYKSFLAEKFKVSELGIFGSYVKGEQTENSDLDIWVEFSEVPTLFDLVEIQDLLSETIGISVDLIEKDSLLPGIREKVLSETVYIRQGVQKAI